jgi:hypothetical protein
MCIKEAVQLHVQQGHTRIMGSAKLVLFLVLIVII